MCSSDLNPDLNDDIYDLIENADLSDDAEKKLERELGRQYHLITRDDRLDTVAQDIVRHFLGRGFQGKAMVVSIDKATALRMYDKVQKYWKIELKKQQKEIEKWSDLPGYVGTLDPQDSPEMMHEEELEARLDYLTETDMAVVVSAGQNEIEQMAKLGIDIVPHRKRPPRPYRFP